jgi:hypothetical protein
MRVFLENGKALRCIPTGGNGPADSQPNRQLSVRLLDADDVRPITRRSDGRDSRVARSSCPPRRLHLVILLDTNVVSALMQRESDRTVVTWLDSLPAESIWTTSVTVFEVRFGLELLADGRKRQRLEETFRRCLEEASSRSIRRRHGPLAPSPPTNVAPAGRSRFATSRSPA